MRRWPPRASLALVVLAWLTLPWTGARAQDDWSISRDAAPVPRGRRPSRATHRGRARAGPPPTEVGQDARVLARLVELVVARPDDESAVTRLLARAAGQAGGVEALVATLVGRREAEGAAIDLALGAIAMARGDDRGALASFEAAVAREPSRASAHALRAALELRGGDAQAAERAAVHQRVAVELAPDDRTRELYLRDLAGLLLEVPGRLAEVREIYAELARSGSRTARTELVRVLAARGRCEDARPDFDAALASVASDASASVGLSLLRSRCEASLGAQSAAREALHAGWSAALRSGRTVEVLDAMLALARETDGLEALELELRGLGAIASLHRGIVLEELGREEEALAVLREVLRRSPRDADTRERLARLLARNGRLEEALGEQRALARLFPDRIALTLELATALRDQGHEAEALSALDRARRRARRDRTALFLLVDAYARLGARDRVLGTLEAIVRASPEDPRGIVALANELLESSERTDRARALALVERLGGSEDGIRGHLEAARTLANLRVFDRALHHLEEAAALAPDAPEVLDAQADVLARAGRDDDAERALERRIALAAESAEPSERDAVEQAEARLVASWARRGRIAEHRAELERDHARGELSASRMLADVQRRSGQLEQALATLLALSERRPGDARLEAMLARLQHEQGDYDGEVRALLRLTELEPARAGWHLSQLVELALASYRDDDAIRFADEATRRAVDDPELHLRLGRLHARRRDPARAARAFERALELDPDAHEAAWELAGLERERGAGRRALQLLLGILERSRDDDLRERAGRALLETARAEGSEEALEPRLLALALAHGDAPVFERLALSLYTSLTIGARARADRAAAERWTSRALPVLLAALRGDDIGARTGARQLLFAQPVAGASQALLAEAADESVDPASRADALAAALSVTTERDLPALEALLAAPNDALAALALHGVVRLGESSARAGHTRVSALRLARTRPGRVGAHAWALTLVLGGAALRDARREVIGEGPNSIAPGAGGSAAAAPEPWIVSWLLAETSSEAPPPEPLLELLQRHASRRERDEAVLHPRIDLLARGTLAAPALDALARAALSPDEHGQLALRALLGRAEPALACAPLPARADSVEAWLAHAIATCPRSARDPSVVAEALVRAVAALDEARVPGALEVVASHGEEPAWRPLLEPVGTAVVARTLPVEATTPETCRALVALAEIVPGLLSERDWRALASRPERAVRAAAVSHAPLPVLAAHLTEVVAQDPAWTVRRAALQRLASGPVETTLLERAVAEGAHDVSAFVRSEAVAAGEGLPDASACSLLAPLLLDRDPRVAEQARSLAERRCAR
jgi:tetratricopeptide (TPR) repeat protein